MKGGREEGGGEGKGERGSQSCKKHVVLKHKWFSAAAAAAASTHIHPHPPQSDFDKLGAVHDSRLPPQHGGQTDREPPPPPLPRTAETTVICGSLQHCRRFPLHAPMGETPMGGRKTFSFFLFFFFLFLGARKNNNRVQCGVSVQAGADQFHVQTR